MIDMPVSESDRLSHQDIKRLNTTIVSEARTMDAETVQQKRIEELKRFSSIRAVMVLFSDLSGRLHFLDYDKVYLLNSPHNLTFDGSSISGFSQQKMSDLRFELDWTSFRYLPPDVFGEGKVLMFANVLNQDGSYFEHDFRNVLRRYSRDLQSTQGLMLCVAPEVEGFIFKGIYAEQQFDENAGFEVLTLGGYFNALPQDELRKFIDLCAETQRALGYGNEKDHPEVASSQFEINFRYDTPVETADRVLLYKLVCRQVARLMGCTACFLPKPIVNVNGSGNHTNMSVFKDGKNLFYSGTGKGLSPFGTDFACGVLSVANDVSLVLVPSVNGYRRLDPHMEAPNEIKMSDADRGSMIRIPVGNENSARVECRVVSPDSNPYLVYLTLFHAGLSNSLADEQTRSSSRNVLMPNSDGNFNILPSSIYDALQFFSQSEFMRSIMGDTAFSKYIELKTIDAGRCPRQLGRSIKNQEVRLHHEVSTQFERQKF